jgi:hypothetical protein
MQGSKHTKAAAMTRGLLLRQHLQSPLLLLPLTQASRGATVQQALQTALPTAALQPPLSASTDSCSSGVGSSGTWHSARALRQQLLRRSHL